MPVYYQTKSHSSHFNPKTKCAKKSSKISISQNQLKEMKESEWTYIHTYRSIANRKKYRWKKETSEKGKKIVHKKRELLGWMLAAA